MSQIVYRVRMPDGGYMGRQVGIVPRSLPSMIDSWTTLSLTIARGMAESVGGKVIKTTVSTKRRCGNCKHFGILGLGAESAFQCESLEGISIMFRELSADDFCSRWEAK